MDKWEKHLKEHKAKRLEAIKASPFYKDLQEEGKNRGIDWGFDNNGKSVFNKIT
jgi:hypothetical protein